MLVKQFPHNEGVLVFGVTPKVFTPCLGVLHVMWGEWCVDDPFKFSEPSTRHFRSNKNALLTKCIARLLNELNQRKHEN
jgi:hypothetical protein